MLPRPQAAQQASGSVPVSAGIGLKPRHFSEVQQTQPGIGWFEVHPENYLVAGGPMHHNLTRIRADYPLSFHSVGMSLGSAEGVNLPHLQRLKELCERYQPALLSDHLSWSRHDRNYLNDLLPIPYTRETLRVFCDNLDRAQNILGRALAVENPSSYLQYADNDMSEPEFLVEVARRSGATLLLDLNNIHVSAVNQGWSAAAYLRQIPGALVSEYHLAGHKVETADGRLLLIDDHGSPVCAEVWDLYAQALRLLGPKPTLIEWDTDVPALPVLLAEAAQADTLLGTCEVRERRHG